ncbi:GTP cyclohydrolase FolE2 [Oceanospirillum sp.]|uniref:GTP cyclohydrolase FolE2 n=1 Tax=Oceanospirillum sp. TaxID=2021254 RepID=UPI003A939E25
MNQELPDVARHQLSNIRTPLEWVGMSGIDIPLSLSEPEGSAPLHASVAAQVNLPDVTVKGIHMSRIYRMLDGLSQQDSVTSADLKTVLEQMVISHSDCGTDSARLVIGFKMLARRSALSTPGLAGWKAYPVKIEAVLQQGVLQLSAAVQIEYSSTCPCSAALARQLIASHFRERFSGEQLTTEVVSDWLETHATYATPHSQRSVASVQVSLDAAEEGFGLMPLIDRTEQALATPVQTAVKRADEQAFALLNGQNLMYVEDAARRIQEALSEGYQGIEVSVRHLESLHPHDAVAYTKGF